jgi:eukaryotic-like serine/threonine-protein kinase
MLTADGEMLGSRFRLLRKIGEGGFATVFEAQDLERDIRVAVKRLASGSPARMVALKREFRALSEVRHPNLVRLFELFKHGEETFFTMELIEGVDFLTWVRGSGALEEARLREAFQQLVAGVLALHDEQIVHRDLKPSNVLVSKEGHVRILDFGLVARRESAENDSLAGNMMGTPHYMAPEQATGDAVTDATDWYSVGVILYEAFTGRVPFEGEMTDVLLRKQQVDPVDPREIVTGIPADLCDLCMWLLSRSPELRPTDAQMRAYLAPQSTDRGSRLQFQDTLPPQAFVGRDDELAFLDATATIAQTGRPQCVLVRGAHGVGKTTLIEHFVEMLRSQGHHVFTARCRAQEHVSFMPLEEIVRGMTQALARERMSIVQVVRKDVHDFVTLFPLNERLRIGDGGTDVAGARPGAARALREIVAKLGKDKLVAIWIDDAQWIDADSAGVLLDMLAPKEGPGFLVIVSSVEGHEGNSPGARFSMTLRRPEYRRVRQEMEVAPLADHAATALASAHLGSLSDGSIVSSAHIASEAGGIPTFVEMLARGARAGMASGEDASLPSLDLALLERVRALSPRARRVLTVIAVADARLPYGVIARASGLDGDEAFAALEELRTRKLVLSHGHDGTEHVELAQARLGAAVTRMLDAGETKVHKEAVARAVVDDPSADAGVAARLLLAVGDSARAADLATRGAERAESAQIFSRAASLYRLAIEAEPARGSSLQARLGEALANAGRGAEAAEAFLAAAETATSVRSIELRRAGAEQLVRSGSVAAGFVRFDEVLRSVAMRLAPSRPRAIFSLAVRRILIRLGRYRFRLRRADETSPARLAKLDVAFSAAFSILIFDPLRGAEIQARHVLLAMRVGEPCRVARALALEAVLTASTRSSVDTRASALLARAEQLTAEAEAAAPRALVASTRALIVLCASMAAHAQGRWQTACELAESAEQLLAADCPGAWYELATARLGVLHAQLALGSLRRTGKQLTSLLRDVEARPDTYMEARLRAEIGPAVWLAAGDVERVPSEIATAVAKISTGAFSLLDFWGSYWGALAAVRRADAMEAARIVARMKRGLAASLLGRAELVRVHAAYVSAIVAMAAQGDRGIVMAAREGRRIESVAKGGAVWARGFGACIRAAIEARRGNQAAAFFTFEAASAAFGAAQMKLFAAASDRRRGEIAGGAVGALLRRAADAVMVAQGVSSPAEFVAMVIPACR